MTESPKTRQMLIDPEPLAVVNSERLESSSAPELRDFCSFHVKSLRSGCHLLRTSFASFGAGKQSVNVQFALSSDIDFAVHDEWNHKPHCQAGAISGDILLAAVKFMRYVCRIESVQNRELIAGIPCLGFHQP